MIKLAANISTLFREISFVDRVAAARASGFRAIEAQFLDKVDILALADAAGRAEVDFVLLNASGGSEGELGFAGLPGAQQRFRESVELALEWAEILHCPRVHVLSGRRRTEVSAAVQRQQLIESFSWAAQRAATHHIDLMIEPLNHRMVEDYLVPTLLEALAVVNEVGQPNLKILFDLYHLQIAGGDVLTRFKNALPWIGHVQIASVPARIEPDAGELDIHNVLRSLDDMGYNGWIGCEYNPRNSTNEGLAWASSYGIRASGAGDQAR